MSNSSVALDVPGTGHSYTPRFPQPPQAGTPRPASLSMTERINPDRTRLLYRGLVSRGAFAIVTHENMQLVFDAIFRV